MYQLETKPLFIFDGDCGFCSYAVSRLSSFLSQHIDFIPYQKLELESSDYRYAGISDQEFQKSVKLIIDFQVNEFEALDLEYREGVSDKRIYSGAEALLKALSYDSRYRSWYVAYNSYESFKQLLDTVYSWIASNRYWISKIFFRNNSCKL